MAEAWTSGTLPRLPRRPDWMPEARFADLYFARDRAGSLLAQAERLEQEARALRKEANNAAEAYSDLLQELAGQRTIEELES